MPALLVTFIIQLVRLLLDGRSNPATDATALNHQAEESASSGNYPLAEKKLLALVNMAERQDGRDGMAVAVYLRRLARLKFEQGDNPAAESLLQRVLTIQEKNLSPRSPDRISTLEWLAHLSQTKGDLDGAVNLTRQILGIRAAAHGGR